MQDTSASHAPLAHEFHVRCPESIPGAFHKELEEMWIWPLDVDQQISVAESLVNRRAESKPKGLEGIPDVRAGSHDREVGKIRLTAATVLDVQLPVERIRRVKFAGEVAFEVRESTREMGGLLDERRDDLLTFDLDDQLDWFIDPLNAKTSAPLAPMALQPADGRIVDRATEHDPSD